MDKHHCHCDGPTPPPSSIHNDPYPNIPNPMPHTYKCPPPPPPIRPLPPGKEKYVTVRQLNEVLQNIADAVIFRDLSVDGTTVTVGGVKEGTKFSKITFPQLISLMLYPKNEGDEDRYITEKDLEDLLNKVAFSGSYNDLSNIPENFDFIYPSEDKSGLTVLNSTVKYSLGGFKEGDSLKGMSISRIIEKLLCGESTGKWGSYKWKTDLYDLPSGEVEIDASVFCPKLVEECNSSSSVEDFFRNDMTDGRYELYAVCATSDRDDESTYRYDCLIKLIDTEDGDNPQVTNPTLPPDVSEDLAWTYNSVTNKVTLLNGAITTDMSLIMLRRF